MNIDINLDKFRIENRCFQNPSVNSNYSNSSDNSNNSNNSTGLGDKSFEN